MYDLIFHEEAEKEYNDAYVWYGLKQVGLEERFSLAVEEILEKLQINPQYFGYRKKPFRKRR